MTVQDAVDRMMSGLLQASHQVTLDRLPGVVSEHARIAGIDQVVIYLADIQQTVLRRLGAHWHLPPPSGGAVAADDAPDELRIDSTYGGRAFQEVRVLRKTTDTEVLCWWVPLLDGTQRLGVLRVHTSRPPEEVETVIRDLASLVGLIVVHSRPYSDGYARIVRSRPMNVAAEMLWNLMPPMTFANPEVTVSGVLEPAYEIGGDAFDYALDDHTLHLAIFDAMGHDLAAGLAANLAMAASRNHRRQGMDLAGNSAAVEELLVRELGEHTRYLTSVMADLDLRTGELTWVNRGHHPPVVIRGGRWVTTLECPPAHPIGMSLDLPVVVCKEQLEPDDRLLLYTDGIVEAGSGEGREFGMSRFVDFIIRHCASRMPVPETLRRLVKDVLDYNEGRLQDDATVLLTEWHGPSAAHAC
ncbi:PP2C family protein-serine/threonine phosphatase [Nonomuraea pusilla]|uniref:Stage II sporulation protein E (SpoIIE) n=1 Tax=Nonomuraea pusilla TaxID=46177 RepID=A0A1H7U671_9ACTN|nr:GAF domain-containing SpoIIE family protein phosphatase [Nonomuraea pusilla]SEL92471.1 Stage II sporulation protein E (SpoIIE) [Nonomuraea pusilla]